MTRELVYVFENYFIGYEKLKEITINIFLKILCRKSSHYEANLCILPILSGFYNKDVPCSSFCSFISFDSSDTILTRLKTCLCNLATYRHKIVRLSSAQLGLVRPLF